jgi:hypothetical protein
MTGDHYGRNARRATLLVRAVDALLGTHRQRPTAVAFGQSALACVSAGTRGPLNKLVIVSRSMGHLPVVCQSDGLRGGQDPPAVKWLEIWISSLRSVIAPGGGAERRVHAGCAHG